MTAGAQTSARGTSSAAIAFLTVEEMAERLRGPRRAVVRLCHEGQLPGARKASRTWTIPERALDAFVDEGMRQAAEVRARREAQREPAEVLVRPERGPHVPSAPRARASIPSPSTDRAGFVRLLRGGSPAPRRRAAG